MKSVLCIEDNKVNQVLLERLLGRLDDVSCTITSTAQSGIELAMSGEYQLVICDLHLPDKDGDAVITALKGNPATAMLPVAVVSADATCDTRKRLLDLGAAHYLTKPFDIKDFYSLVSRLLP